VGPRETVPQVDPLQAVEMGPVIGVRIRAGVGYGFAGHARGVDHAEACVVSPV